MTPRPMVAYYAPIPPEHVGQVGVRFLARCARLPRHGMALEWRRACLVCRARADHFGIVFAERDLPSVAIFRICFPCSTLEDLEARVREALPEAQVAEP